MHIEQVILELLYMFYFKNICNILDSRDEICVICISSDWKLCHL